MIRVKKRKKATRFRGSHSHGRGFKKKARGSGHRGGVGMAGTGKRGDQKKTLVTKLYGGDYFGKDKTLRRGPKTPTPSISISTINNSVLSLIEKGLGKDTKEFIELDLSKYKIIGNDSPVKKMKISAKAASKGAQEAIRKAGGEIVIAEKR